MREVGAEPVTGLHRVRQRAGQIEVCLGDRATAPADQVQVVDVIGDLVRRRAVLQVGMRNDAETFEQLKRPVDGGEVQRGGLALNELADLLRSGMTKLGNGAQYEPALRRGPQPTRPQNLIQPCSAHRRHTRKHKRQGMSSYIRFSRAEAWDCKG